MNPQWSLKLASTATVNNIRIITLDLDDTLWEIHPVIRRAEQRLYEWLGENFPRITEMYTPTDLREVRSQIVIEFADRAADLTIPRPTGLGRIGVAAVYGTAFID